MRRHPGVSRLVLNYATANQWNTRTHLVSTGVALNVKVPRRGIAHVTDSHKVVEKMVRPGLRVYR